MNRSDIEDFDKDVSESQRIVAKYPEYVPVIVKSKKINLSIAIASMIEKSKICGQNYLRCR